MLRTARGAAGALRRIPGSVTGVERNGPAPLARTALSRGFLDFKKTGNKNLEAIEKEKARLKDEMSRGYFADIAEMRKNSGKIAAASKVIIPEADAVKFPDLAMESPDGASLRLPLVAPSPEGDGHEAGDAVVPYAPLVSLFSCKLTENGSLVHLFWMHLVLPIIFLCMRSHL